ncbi:DUF2380 domain-containing protein [Xanthomarina gelatinilytica]|nr:RHS repeat-associated core domain-containing protein [Xanthomarina gelatinilytica]
MKKLLFTISLFIISWISYSQCTNDCVYRGSLAGFIYEVVYNQNNPDNYQPMASYPTAYIDNTGSVELDKKISLVSYLDYGDGITVLGHLDSSGYLLTSGIVSRGEALVAIMEAWNIPPDFTGSVSYNDVDPNHEYYGYINEAEDLNLLDGLFGSNFNSDFGITTTELVTIVSNVQNTSYHPVSNAELLNEDNYFTPNNYQSTNLNFLRGLEQGVFSHYAKNSFVIPDVKFNLNFSHYYSTQMVELPQSYFPIKPLGRGWTHTYNSYVQREEINGQIFFYIVWSDGTIHIWDDTELEYITKGVYNNFTYGTGDDILNIKTKDQTQYYFEQLDDDEEIFYLVQIVDSNGNEINIEYETSDVDNDFKRIEWVEAPSGKKLHFYYHNNTDLIDYIEDPINRQISFTYTNDINRLKRFYDAKGQDTRYYYLATDDDVPDEHAYQQYLLRKVRLPEGNSVTAEYDDDNDGKLNAYQINDNPSILINVDYSNYDAITSTVTMPMPTIGDTQDFDYEFNSVGMVTHFQNDTQDINISYPNPTNVNALLPTNININGLDIDYEYDTNGNVTEIQKEGITDEDFEYDSNNNLIHYQDANGNDTFFNYDSNNNLTSIVDALGHSVTFGYDSFGQVTSVTNQEGITINYTYESDGVVSLMYAPEGLSSTFSYDGVNRLLSQTINNQTSSFIHDDNDNLTSHTNIGGLTTTFNYDQNDNLITITNANGVNTSFTYNTEDQVVSETFGSLVKQYEYNDDGTLDKYIKPSGQEINYDYLSDGKLNEAGTISDIDYYGSSDGKKEGLISSIASDDLRYNFDYDTLNRLDEVEIDNDPNNTITYDYDNVGNITRIYYPDSPSDFHVHYYYDAKNRLQEIRTTTNGTTQTAVEYLYLDDNRLDKIFYHTDQVIEAQYSYDDAGRLTKIEHIRHNDMGGLDVLFSQEVTLDVAGNVLTDNSRYYEAIENEEDQQFNLQDETYAYNSTNHITQAGSETLTVDTDGNTIQKGNINYQYNIDDQLTSVTGNNGTTNIDFQLQYDAYGNRVQKNILQSTTTPETKRYVWDIINNNVIKEYNPTTNEQVFYVYGASGLEFSVTPSGLITNYFHGDIRGSVVFRSNPQGYIAFNHFNKYDDFGNVVTQQTTDTETFGLFTYLGKYGIMNDVTTHNGLYYIKARYYDAKLGRFLTQDPIWSTNLYPYAENNPISGIDKTGNYWETALDVASLGESSYSLYNNPNLENAGLFFWDFMAVFTPAPGSYLAKGGKYAAKYSDEIVQGGQLLIEGASSLHKHHIFPQQFGSWFAKRGISINDFTIPLSQRAHLRGVHGKGLDGKFIGRWNQRWLEFIENNPNANASEVFYFGESLLQDFGLDHLNYIKY